jgi:excisionase family DNA binding protein
MHSSLVTKREAADILDVHLSTVNRMVSDGRLKPARQFDGERRVAMYLFRRSDVVRLHRSRTESVAS